MTHRLFHFIRFKDIKNWSVLQHQEHDFGYSDRYPLVAIGEFLVPNQTIIMVQDDVEYKQLTVKTKGGGVCLRCLKKGKDIGTKQQWVARSGQFVLSKIDARNGAMGVVTDELDGAIVTHDFPLFDVTKDVINPHFLLLIITTESFMKFAQSCSSGTTNRQRINVKKFLQQRIPLPSLAEQNRLVEVYNNQMAEAKGKVVESECSKDTIKAYMQEVLGINTAKKVRLKGLFSFVRFKDILQWGVDMITMEKVEQLSQKYPSKPIDQLGEVGSGGTPSRSIKSYYNGNIPWIKTGEVLNDIITDTEEKITEDAVANSSAKMYPIGSLIVAMYGHTRGRTAKLGINATTNQACAVIYNINNDEILTDYLWYYLQSQFDEIRALGSGTGQPNLNAGHIKNYRVVVPPLSVQQEIVDHVTAERSQAKALKEEAIHLREQAKIEFEKQIFVST